MRSWADVITAALELGGQTLSLADREPVPIGTPGIVVATMPGLILQTTEPVPSMAGRVAQMAWRWGLGDYRYMGTWVSAGRLYVDPVRILPYQDGDLEDRKRALTEAWALGRAAAQLAVFDLGSGTEIAVPGGR